MVSNWLTKVKNGDESSAKGRQRKNRPRETKPVFIKSFGSGEITGDIAGSGWSASRPGHADRWKIAKTGTRPPSACSGCKPPPGRAGRRGLRQRLRPCGG